MAKTLLDLPSEIRMEIYSYLLITDTGINPFSGRSPGTLHLHPAILRTCKGIYKDAATVLTQRNLFIYQSYHSAAHYKTLPPKSDRSWTIVKRQFHCAPTYAPAGPITSRSHPIRHLEIRLNGEIDYQVAMAMLSNVLGPHNMLKTLELEMWDIWERNKLHKVLTKMAGSPDRIAISLKIFERSWTLELERGCDRLRESIMEWNQTSERRYVETQSEMTTEQWNRLWVRGCFRVRRWTLSPCVATRWSEMYEGFWWPFR